jgi:hypothetical protein
LGDVPTGVVTKTGATGRTLTVRLIDVLEQFVAVALILYVPAAAPGGTCTFITDPGPFELAILHPAGSVHVVGLICAFAGKA